MKGKKGIIFGTFVIVTAMVLSGIHPTNASHEKGVVWANATKVPIKIVKLGHSVATAGDGNVLVSANSEYDDVMPAITTDDKGHIVVTWTQQQGLLAAEIGWAYSSDNGQTWTSYITTSGGMLTQSDISWQDCPTYKGLFGVYLDEGNENNGFYTIGDITDTSTFTVYRWNEEAPEQVAACISDHTGLVGQYNHVTGPANMYIYHFTYGQYDIPACPEQMITDVVNGSGEATFDGQTHLISAPAENPDMSGVNMDVHYAWDFFNSTLNNYEVIWKKIIPVAGDTDSTDIEYTPYQKYIDVGIDPAIAKSGNNVVIVYMNNQNIYGDWDLKCAYSNDDGATWKYSNVTAQHPVDEMYPDVYMAGNNVYVAYVSNGNLYLIKSTDGGATWGQPTQVNDVNGSVNAEPRCVEISAAGIVWEDKRNGNIDVYYAPLPAPLIQAKISGGFGITIHVSNAGSEAAQNVPWTVDISGGLVIVGKHKEGTIPSLQPGQSADIKVMAIGIGKIKVTANIGGTTATASGFLLGPLVIGLK